MGLAVSGEHVDTTFRGQSRSLTNHAALADSRRPHHVDDATGSADRLVKNAGDGVQLPAAADQFRIVTTLEFVFNGHRQPLRTDLASDHFAGVDADPQLQRNAVMVFDFCG